MSTTEQKILNNYFGLLERVTPTMQLRLIDKPKESAKKSSNKKSNLKVAFGAWSPEESAEELIETIPSSRSVYREIEEL